jgi:DNA-binding beta-propeller fold protein YncE
MSGMRLTRATARAATAMVSAAVAVCAGCTSAAAHPPGPASANPTRTAAPSPAATASAPPSPPVPSGALASPGCTSAVSTAGTLTSVATATLPIPGAPSGVAATPDGHWAFTAITVGASSPSVEVLRLGGALAPTVVRDIPVAGEPLGEAITPDGKYLLVADGGDGAAVISVARAEAGTAAAVLGTLHAPGGGGAGEVAVSPDGRFAFVTLEQSESAAVFNLGAALSRGFGVSDYVGTIPLGIAPVGIAVSPDGRWLYATSEEGTAALRRAIPSPGTSTSAASPAAVPGTTPGELPGTLTVVNLRRAETDPAASVVVSVAAGCQPVRVITSADGSQIWVTVRASDDVLCYSAARLATDPSGALVAAVRVGAAPVGLAAVRGGSLLVVADSDRFAATSPNSELDVVNVAAALAGRPAVVGHIPAGAFPRDMTLAPDGRLLVSNYSSNDLEAVDVATIPGG